MKPWWQVVQMGRIMSEFDDDGGGGGGADDLDLDEVGGAGEDGDLDEKGGGGEGDDPSSRRVASVVPPVDPEAIAAAVRAGIKDLVPAQKQPEMSEEEFRKVTDYYAVDANYAKQFAKILGIDVDDLKAGELAKLLQNMLDGTTKHALKTAGLMQTHLETKLSDRVKGLESNYAKRETERFLESVQTKYPALTAHRDILPDVLNALKASGVQPKNQAEAVKLVAKAARDHIRKYVPNFMTAENPGSRRMASSINGGGASTGGFGAGGNKTSKAASLPWDA